MESQTAELCAACLTVVAFSWGSAAAYIPEPQKPWEASQIRAFKQDACSVIQTAPPALCFVFSFVLPTGTHWTSTTENMFARKPSGECLLLPKHVHFNYLINH